MILYNFQPNEKGRIFLYNESLIEKSDLLRADSMSGLTAWDEFQVDGSGQLILEIEKGTNPEEYFLIGNSSGEVHVPFDWGTINNILCSSKVKVIFPTYADLRNVNSLWDLAHYRDLREPGTQTYNAEVRSADKWRWGFSWCAINSETLSRIEFPLSIQFFIDDIELSDHAPQIVEESQTTSNGWECSRWSIILANWKSNSQVKLEVRYSLSESIFDGEETYPAGEYHQVIYVDVRE